MCGIAGFRTSSDAVVSPPDLDAMVASIEHRGPDSAGFHRAPGVGLGMRRLSIIDLETGDQPFANEDGTVWVVANGEIYNYKELRAQLIDRGHRFATQSDIETLVHGWEEWGEGLLSRLRGMFAFALWDGRHDQLILGRDSFGIKPLFYTRRGSELLFGSEIKCLLAAGVERRLDPRALDSYLAFLYVPEPRTIFEGIRALPAGCLLVCPEDGPPEERRYARYQPEPGGFRDRPTAVEAVREVVDDSVRAMLVADVPVGLFLSAGIDSASILAAMSRHSSEPVRTFSIGFGTAEHRWDELEGARRLAEAFGSEHREFQVEPELVSQLPRVVRHFDQPFANPTATILDLLSRETRQHVKVALSGTGGDEFFAGYPRHLGMLLYRRYGLLPRPLRRGLAALSRTFLRDATDGRHTVRRLRRFLEGGALPFDQCYAQVLTTLENERRRALHGPRLTDELADHDATDFVRQILVPRDSRSGSVANGASELPTHERLLAADVETYLVFNQLAYADRMSMANSLEVRVPFVDQRVADVARKIPLAWHLRRGTTKALLREAVAPWLPADIVAAPKRGLNLPIALWFRGPLRSWIEDLLSPERLEARALLRPDTVRVLLDEHLAGRRDHSLVLWALVALELWFQEVFDD